MSSNPKICGSGSFVWSREATTTLISMYDQNPALYEVKSEIYHNKNRRQAILQKIVREINERHMTNLTVAEVAKKVHSLRTNFFQELNEIKKSEKSGAATDEIYVSKWWCFELLEFLRDSSAVVYKGSSNMPTAAVATVETEKEVGEEEIIFEGTIQDFESLPPFSPFSAESSKDPTRPSSRESFQARTKKQKVNDAGLSTLLSTATSALQKIQDTKEGTTNKHLIFGQMIAAEMGYITNEGILDTFKEEVMTALFRAERRNGKKINF